jgi:hypothetical protein
MNYPITLRPETSLDITTYWLVVDGDNVGTIAPFRGVQLVPVSVAEHWIWRINFPMMHMPQWCRGRAPSLEQAHLEAERAYLRIRKNLSDAEYNDALWKRDGKMSDVIMP